jgi:hypothetical protein
MGSHKIHFYDSAGPENIASGVYAAVYVNGFPWPEDDVRRMKRVFRVSVEREAVWAKAARTIDVENGAALPEDVVPFIKERRSLGFNDATSYVNRSNWDDVVERVEFAKIHQPFYWVATLDGTQEVSGLRGTPAWAVQYQGGPTSPFDVSVLHGKNNFVPSH